MSKIATETCLFCGRKIPDRTNAETIREFVQRFKKIARKTELIEFGTERIVSYGISPQKLDELVSEMIEEVNNENSNTNTTRLLR